MRTTLSSTSISVAGEGIDAASVGAVLADEVEDLPRELGAADDQVRQQDVVLVVDEGRSVHAAGEQARCPGHGHGCGGVPLVLAARMNVGIAEVTDDRHRL